MATKIDAVSLQGLTVGPYRSSGTTVSGKVQNGGTASIVFPEVQVFSLNDVGRPLAQGFAYEDGEILPGAGWSFEVSVPGPFATHATRFDYADQ